MEKCSSPDISNNHENASETEEICIPLPDELLSEIIFQFIPLCQWSSSLELVSRQFQNCVIIAYNKVKSINFRKLFSLKQTVKVKIWGPYSELIFPEQKCTPSRLNDILTKLSIVCPNLTEFSGFEYITVATDADSWTILKKFDNLKALSLTRVDIPFRSLADFMASAKNMQILKVFRCYFLHDDILGTLDVSSLSCLELYCNESKPENYRQTFHLENISDKLTTLKLGDFGSCFQDTTVAEQVLKKCTNLESFHIHLHNSSDDCRIFFNTLPHLHKLTSLRIIGDDDSYPLSLDRYNAGFCNCLDLLKNQLQSFDIYNIEITESFQNVLYTNCTHLQSLGVNRLSENPLRNLSRLSGTLKKLFLTSSYDPQVLPVLFSNLVQLTHLTDLSMVYDPGLDPNVWENLWRLESLRNLTLHDYLGRNINDAFLQKWNEKNSGMLEKLVTLELSDCGEITDVGACLLAKKAKNLEILDLSWSRIGDLTILTLAEVAKKLKKANFWQKDPSLIGADAVLVLIENSVDLKHLVLNNDLAAKVVRNNAFLPFVEYVEICSF